MRRVAHCAPKTRRFIIVLRFIAMIMIVHHAAFTPKRAEGILPPASHLITRVKSNAVAYEPCVAQGPKKRGRPRLYGRKIALRTLLNDPACMQQAPSPVYGEENITLNFHVRDLLWRPTGRLVRFVAVVHPARGSCLLMSTDTTLSAIDIIRAYGLRFKIEHTFKQAVRLIGTFSYHFRFWMKAMTSLRRGSGNQYLHRKSAEYRDAVKRKMNAYHLFIQAGVISQGLLQYLAVVASTQVCSSFGSWLRTIRPCVAPSELVVASALRQTLPEFLLNSVETASIAKFMVERQDSDTMEMFSVAS
jgi:hypothetical protein